MAKKTRSDYHNVYLPEWPQLQEIAARENEGMSRGKPIEAGGLVRAGAKEQIRKFKKRRPGVKLNSETP